MISHILTVCRFGSYRPGFFSGTFLLVVIMLSVHASGIQASLSLGPEGNLPRFRDVFLYALSHDDAPSLLVNLCCLLLVGPCQERRWGTLAFLSMAVLTWAAVPCAYTLVLWVGVGEASRVCGYSAVQLALFTAQCRQVRGRRLLRCVPVWLLPWVVLLLALLLLPGTPGLMHFCSICIGHNYTSSFVATLQELEHFSLVHYVPQWAYVSSSSRLRLPTHADSHRTSSHSEALLREKTDSTVSSYHLSAGTGPGMDHFQFGTGPGWGVDHFQSGAVPDVDHFQSGAGPGWGVEHFQSGVGPGWGVEHFQSGAGPEVNHFQSGAGPGWGVVEHFQSAVWNRSDGATEEELLEDQMLRAGILASLQDHASESPHTEAVGRLLESSDYPPEVTARFLASSEGPEVTARLLETPEAKVELPKSSVSSLRLQQLERMGFPTDKAVVALAASKQLEGAVSLLIHDRIGPEAVVVGAKTSGPSPHR